MAVIVVTRRNIFAIKMGSKVGVISGLSLVRTYEIPYRRADFVS